MTDWSRSLNVLTHDSGEAKLQRTLGYYHIAEVRESIQQVEFMPIIRVKW
jgi:hypothetical protein